MHPEEAIEFAKKHDCNRPIKRDFYACYCLNDIGYFFNKKPEQWLKKEQVKGFIKESFSKYPDTIKKKRGRNGGVYAYSEIARKYLMWLSPEFEYRVFEDPKLLDITFDNVLITCGFKIKSI